MIIQCEKCRRKFKIEDSEITTPGGKVTCPDCGYAFSAGEIEISYGEESDEQQDSLTDSEVDKPGHKSPAADKSDQEAGADDSYALTDDERTGDASGKEGPPGREKENESKDFTYDLKDDLATGDGGNWEDFVSISKSEEQTEELEISHSPDTDTEDQYFNWEKLGIDREPVEVPDTTPRLFEDEEGGRYEDGGMDSEDRETRAIDDEEADLNDNSYKEEKAGASYRRKSSEKLAIDMDVLSNNPLSQKGFSGASRRSPYQSRGLHTSRSKSGGGAFRGIAYGIIAAAVLIVIITASYIILLNTGVIPKETSEKVRNLAQSIIPLDLSERAHNDVIITEHAGRWMNTRNGPLYIVSGKITNRARHPVHFVKIHSEFLSAGQILFENDIYAGNTFTENELKVSPLQDVLLKLKKKNGNIDYYNTNKLAGLNYNIQPGESIPFYSVFLPQSRVLGLKYNLRIADYEDPVSN